MGAVNSNGISDTKLTPAQFDQLTKLLGDYTGLHFPAEKQNEFEHKLTTRMSLARNLSADEFISSVASSEEFRQEVLNCLTVGESYFFRNKPHFDALRDDILPGLIERAKDTKKLRIWCAGCATGEEPYSIAILIREEFKEILDWDIRIIASDINTDFLSRAEEGLYTKWSFRGVEDSIVFGYFSEEADNHYRLHADVRRSVEFRKYNLADIRDSKYVSAEPFDLVLCRNVLIYFSFEAANRIISKFVDVSRKGSFLFVGHSEAFPALSHFDVVYSHATYYYKYRQPSPRYPKGKAFSLGPASTLSIPGIGVHTVLPKSPEPPPFANLGSINDYGDASVEPEKKRIQSKSSFLMEKTEPINVTAELERARLELNEGNIEKTHAKLDSLSKTAGKLDYRVHFLCAIVSDQTGHFKDSVASLKRSIFLNKNFVLGHFYLAVIYERESDFQSSARFFRNTLNLLNKMPSDHLLDEAEGLSCGRLREIVEARFSELEVQS